MSHTENTPLLEVRNLKKYFGKKDRVLHAVDDISVTIQQGKTLGVVGESGCGKSTLGRTVLRLLEPTDGQIIFDGQDITHVSEREMRKYRQSMQIIFQDPFSSLQPRMPVGEIIGEAVREHGLVSKEEFDDYIDQVMDNCGLQPFHKDRYPHEFSGGQRQRVSLARAFLKNAPILVLDEATASLDMKSEEQIQKEIERLASGRTTFIIAHRFSTIRMADRILVLEKGRVVADGTHEELMASSPLYRELYNKQQMVAEEEGGAPC